MYKVQGRNNKVIYRLQDFTKNDNVDESMFEEGRNSQGTKRLQCTVKVLHTEEFEALQHKQTSLKEYVEDLQNKIKQKNVEIKRLEDKLKENEQAHEHELLQKTKYNYELLEEVNGKHEKLEKQHREDIEELKETHANQLLAIDETHRKQLQKLRSQYNAKLDEVNEHLFESVKANGNARDKLRVEMLQLKETHKAEVLTLQSQHHHELEKVQHAHANELQTLEKQHTYDIDQLKQAVAEIKQEHLVKLNEIERSHIHEVENIRNNFLKLLATEHAKDMSDLNDCAVLPFYIKPFIKAHLKALDEFKKRKYENTPQKIVESYDIEHLRVE